MSWINHSAIQYETDGMLLLRSVFTEAETERFRSAAMSDFTHADARVIKEADGVTPRVAYGGHKSDFALAQLASDRRLLDLAQCLIGDSVYVYQFKVNYKAPKEGKSWPWHEDWIYWQAHDLLPDCRLVNIALLLDDMSQANGPLQFYIGSHVRDGDTQRTSWMQLASEQWDRDQSANLSFTIGVDDLAEITRSYPLCSLDAPAGSVVVFDPRIVHGSSDNVSNMPRLLAIITYNSTSNRPRRPLSRPWFLAEPDSTPVDTSSTWHWIQHG